MKLLFVLVLCSIAIAVKQDWSDVRREEVTDISYVPQREYHYLYDGQISTGIPRGSDQRGTTRIQSLVSFIFQRNGKTVLMQMKKIRFGSSNGELQDPKEVQKFQLFEEKELDQEQEEILKRPLRFKYVNGLISELEFDQMDKPWSKNIKRAVLSMLQVDMKRYVPLKEVESEGWDEERGDSRDFRFKHERTVEGDCETLYTFVVPETTRKAFNVTKSINFEKCRERVDIRYNFRFGEVCKSCEDQFDDEEHATKTSTVYTYGIVGTKDRFLVQRSEVRSQYIYSPLSKQDNVLTSYVVGRIVLYKVKEGESNVELPETERKESLLYRPEREIMIERFVMNGDEELQNGHPFREVKNKVEVAGNTIRRMMKSMVDTELGIETEAAEQMSRLVQVLRMCSKDELERIHEQFFQRSEQFDDKTTLKVREVLIDAYSLAGTKNTIELLVEKIEDHKILPLKAWNALQNLATLKVTSEKQIDMVLRLCKSEVCERNPILKQTCLLSTGSMINALCGITKDHLAIEQKEEKKCPRQLKEKYVEELMNLFRESRTRYEKILVLKTLANAGLDVSVQHIERIIVNRQLDRIIRTQAIDSLRRLRSVMPRKIQRILMPIFKSTYEPVELRLNALAQIMYTLPERAILDQIADTLFKEQSRQVKGFVYSMLQTFSKSRNPCEKKMVEDLRTSLRLLRVHISKWSDSKFVHWPLYSNEHKTGMTVDLATIFHNEGLLPRELMMNLDTIFGGQWRKYVAQLGFVQYNGEQLLETLLKITKEKMADTGSVRPQQVLSELYKKLNIRDRRERSSPFAMLFVRRNDQDFAVLPLDLETLPQEYHIFREGKLNLARLQHIFSHPIRIHNHWAHYVYDSSRTVPTSLGLPLIISGEVPTLTGWDGEVKVEMEPERSEELRRVTLHMRIHPKIAIVHVTKMRTWNPVVNSGFKAVQLGKFHFPIDVSVEVNMEKNFEIKYTFKVPQQKKQILSLQSRLMTVTSFSSNNAKAYIEPKVKTVHLEKEPQMLKSIETSFGEKFFGINFDVRGHYYQHSESMVKGLLFNENVLEVNMIPRSNAPREVVTKFKFDVVEEVQMEKPQLEGIYQEWEDNDYETEKWEGEREVYDDEVPEEDRVERKERKRPSEHERRREFSQYVNDYKEKKGYKLRMRMHVETIGTNVERTGELEMWTACDSSLQFCKLNLKGSRSPIFEHENGKWTIDMKVESLYPLRVRSLSELKERKHREFQAKIDCKWGEEEKQTINVKIQGEQCNEQQRILSNVLENVNKPVERYNEILLASQLNQYKVVADYRLTKGFKEYLYKMFQWTVSRNLLNTETKQFKENKENKLYVKLTIDPRSHQHVSMLVQTPLQTVQFWNIHVPLKLAPFMVNIHKQTTPVRSLRHFAEQVTYEDRAECKVNSKRVDTFDEVNLKVPITTCYSVLAKDCTSEEPKFVVMLKKIIKGEEEKKMKIIDEDRTIEIERKEGELKVKVNGHVINDEERLLEYKINLKDDMVIIELEDVLVRFDGYTVSMKLSGLFKNKVCGICGHYDDEQGNELRKSDNEWTDDVEEFHRSYFTRDEECDIDEEVVNERRNYALSVDKFTEELIDEEKPIKKPIKKTRVIEYNHEICFSMKPVPECPKDTYENDEKSVDKKISFTCLRRSHHETTKLTRRARTHVLNMEDYKPSFVETISIPEECLVF